MGVEIKGEAALLAELERRLGGAAAIAALDRALIAGAEVFVRELKRQMKSWKDTGATIREITIDKPRDFLGERIVSIHWKGPKNRYRIIHLNEFGTVKNPNPRGKGSIARALRNSEKAYRLAVRRELEGIGRG